MEIVSIKIGDDEILFNPNAGLWDLDEGILFSGAPKIPLECNYKMSCINSDSGEEMLINIHSFKEIRKGKLEVLTTNGNTIEIEGDFEAVE